MFLKDLPQYPIGGSSTGVCLSKLVEVIREANNAILEIYNNTDRASWEVQLKTDNSPLTKADREAHNIIVKHLKSEVFPSSIHIISEEDEIRSAVEERKSWEYVWLIDPLDGTKEFIKRNGEFTVNIGLERRGVAVGGVVSIPVLNICYIGFEGMGAWKLNFNEDKLKRIECKSFNWSDRNLVVMGSRSHGSTLMDDFLNKLSPDYELKVSGSSLKMLAVAEGTAHMYPRFVPCCEWDTCAAHAIVKEAGGEIYQIQGLKIQSEPLQYNKNEPNFLQPYFICIGKISDTQILLNL